MKKKLLSALLAATMISGLAAGCGDKAGAPAAGGSTESGAAAAADEGKVLNVYCWNDEFSRRVRDYYPGYEEVDATHGKIGDVQVVWHITPNQDNAYQQNLDETLLKQADAPADEKIDIFLMETDYASKYTYTDYTMALEDLGITGEDMAEQYQYTKDVVKDENGRVKATSWQAAPGVLFYSRAVAKEVFGTDDPAQVQEYVKDWDTFNETANTLKEAGYYALSTPVDTFRVYCNNATSPWVVDGKINLDENVLKWVEDSKKLVDAGVVVGTHGQFNDDWNKGFYEDGKVFAYFGPAWMLNFCMAADQEGSIAYNGGWGAVKGPQGFFWGGTWLAAAQGTDNVSLIRDIMLKLTCDGENMKQICLNDDEFVNNKPIMEEMANDPNYSSRLLGGQNPLGEYCEGVANISMDNLTPYDQGCVEQFSAAMKNYFDGTATQEEALALFYKAVGEKYPELAQ